MATVFLLAGVAGLPSEVRPMLQYAYTELDTTNTIVEVTYPNLLPPYDPGIVAGAATLDGLLRSTPGQKIIKAHSEGAIVATRWLHDYGPTSSVDPAEVQFILCGNSVRRYTGFYVVSDYSIYGIPNFVSPDNNVPVNTPYSVTDIAVQYDGWADMPADLSNWIAVLNAGGNPPGGSRYHLAYNDIPLDRDDYSKHTDGNVTYVWAPTKLWGTEWQRDTIEAAYTNRPVQMFYQPAEWMASFAEPFTGTDHDDFAAWARELREYRIERASDPPRIRLYDGNWVYRGTVYGEIAGSLTQIVNESGTIQLRLPIDLDDPRGTWAAFWALDEEARGTSNIHIIVEVMGARIGGRMKSKDGLTLKRDQAGDELVIDFLDDIEELKYVHTAGNPFLPISLIQQPKAWMLLLEADYAILLTMAANLLRLELTNIDIADLLKLLDPANWTLEGVVDVLLNFWQQSQIVIKPRTFGDSIAPLALVVGSINTNIFDVAAPILEDAELQWDLRRWLDGDPEPWPGAGTNWRNGTLMVGIVDKSGFRTGTSIGGNLLTGLTRTIADLTSNYIEDSYDLFTGDVIDSRGYQLPGILGTQPANPYVVYRDGDITGIQTSEFSRSPGGPGRITVGGQSMPGVNELIGAAIRYGGDVLGDNLNAVISFAAGIDLSVGSLGAALDAFLEPIYKDSILAHISVPLLLRVSQQGWGHYLETNSTNVTQAFTAASIMDLRARRRETDPDLAFTLKVANASPWLIGDNGFGHWWLGDRVGGTSKYLMPRVYVRRNRQLKIDWDNSQGVKIDAEFANTRNRKDAIVRMTELIGKAMSGLQQIGLW